MTRAPARQEGRTKTEILREALRGYGEERRWRKLQRYGAGRARKVGLREADVEGSVQEAAASPAQRARYEIIGDGRGVHWPDVDEDISAEGMLAGGPARPPKQKRE